MKTITFEDACKIINECDAVNLDGSLSFPAVTEDYDGNDCIEINWYDEDGLVENTFTMDDKYYINDEKCLIIDQDKTRNSVIILKYVD